MPDQAFALDEQLCRRLGRRFDSELALWASADTEAGIPTIGEMSLMPVTPQWLPIEDSFERQLVERLVADGRVFIKGLRYNLQRGQCLATATLTDAGEAGSMMFVLPPGLEGPAVVDGFTGANLTAMRRSGSGSRQPKRCHGFLHRHAGRATDESHPRRLADILKPTHKRPKIKASKPC